jgi:arylsulfatase A-like enzyme
MVAKIALNTDVQPCSYLVIIADDLGVDKVGSYIDDYTAYGYAPSWLPATDTIDSLAAAGLRFTRVWATLVCSPTRASFQTGQQPFRTRIGR